MDKSLELTFADAPRLSREPSRAPFRAPSTVDRLEARLLLAGDITFDYSNFADLDGLSLRATAFQDGNTLELNEIASTKAGAVWYDTAFGLQAGASFSTQFVYSSIADPFSGQGGEGFALLIQGNGADQDPTATGDALGYRGMANSVAIELDMRNSNAGDPTPEHLGLHIDGSLFPQATGISELNFNNGTNRYVWVDYNGDTEQIQVYFNNSDTKPSTAVIDQTVDIAEIVGDDAWIGFTASTSGFVGTHTLKSWNFESSGSAGNGGTGETTEGFQLNGFGQLAPVNVVGDAEIVNGRVRVTGNTPEVSGALWYRDPIAIGDGIDFNTTFTFRIDGGSSDNKGEGFAFVLQSQSNDAISPFGGNSLGYQNLRRSIAVEFDTFQNAFGEVSGNHVAVHVNGNRTNAIAATTFDDVLFNASEEINVWIDYDHDSTLMEVFVSNDTTKPSDPTLSANVDVSDELGATAYAGFTASTSKRRNAHKIEKWTFNIGDPVIDNGDTFRFLHGGYSFDESADLVNLTIVREGQAQSTSNVIVRFANGSAIKGTDYGLPTTTLVFAPGETQKTIQVRMLEDSIGEGDETFGLNLKYLTNNPLPPEASIQVKIVDDEPGIPTGTQIDLSSFASSDPVDDVNAAAFANGEIVLTTDTPQIKGAAWSRDPVRIDANTSVNSSFSFRIDGGNDDWRGEGLAFVLQPGGTEVISDFVGNSLGYQSIPNSIAVEFDTFGNDFGEVSGNHVAIHLNGNRSDALAEADLPIELNSGDTIYAWVDYSASSQQLEVFVATTNNKPASPTITATVDLHGTMGEDWFYAGFTASTSGRRNAHVVESLTLSTSRDATPGTFAFTSSRVNIDENSNGTLTVSRTGGTDGAVTVQLQANNVTASNGDYSLSTTTLNFADGEASKTVTITPVNDNAIENNETFNVQIISVSAGSIGSTSQATVTIVDDDAPVDPNGFVNRGLMGVNLEKLGSGTTQWDFTDLMKNASFWAYTGGDPRSGQPVETLDANGYPILQPGEQARTVVRGWGNGIEDVVPAGQYTLTWEGTGEIGVFGIVNTGNFTSNGGSNSQTINIPRPDGTGASIRVNIASSDPNDPIRNVRFYMPGYGPGEANFGQVFHQQFLDYLQPFSILRLMDWSEASSSELENWSDRPTTDYFSYAENEFGVPIEDMVALANESGLDPWFNMPPRASDDYIQRFAQYVKNNLDPSLNIYLEYGNEVWAPTVGGNAAAAAGYNYVTERIAQTGQSRSDPRADEIERDFEIWTNEFGGQASRLNRVAAGQGRNRNSINLQLLESLDRDGTLGVDTLSLAAYIRSDFSIVGDWNNPATPSPSLDDIFAALRLDLDGKEDTTIISGGSNDGQATGLWAWQRQLADQFGLNLIAYEGGQQLAPNSNTRTWYDEYVEAQTDPRMQELYNELLEKYLFEVGADGFVHYTTIGPIGSFGAWGLLEDQQQTLNEAPKYRAVVSFALGNPTLNENLYTFAENAGNQTLTLTRVGNTSVPLTVNVRTVDGVATAGSDFGAINQTITFAAGQSQRTVNLSITNDNIAEATERLYLEMRYEDANGFIMDEAVVVIEDNDSLNGSYANRDLLGVNLEKLTEFASQYDFADLMKHAFPWVFPEGSPFEGSRVPYDSLGNPLLGAGQQAAAAVRLSDDNTWLSDFPDGAYTLTWSGTGTLEVENNGVSVGTFTSNGGSNTQTVNLTSDNPGGSVILYVRSSDPNDPVKDFRLYMPGYAPGQTNGGQTFHSAVLDTIEPFGILRYMDWMKANLTTVEDWVNRPRTNDVSYLMDDAGVPIQDIVELGNLATSHIWLNMPVRASDDYIRNMAEYVKDNLDPRLTVYVEYGNEVWAPTVGGEPGVGYGYITEQINASGRNEDDRIDVWSEEMVKDFNVWMDVFSDQPERVQRVAAGQGRNRNSVNAQLLEALSSTGEVKFDVFSAAAYIRPVDFGLYDDWNDPSQPLPTVDDVIDSLFDDLAIKFDDTIQTSGAQEGQATGLWSWHRQLADQYDADLIAYEGGQQLFPGDRWYDVYADAQRDPRMNELYDEILETYLVDVGADGFVHYSSVGSITPFGAWGAKEYQNQPNSEAPKYQALLDFANGAAASSPLSFTAGEVEDFGLIGRPDRLVAPLGVHKILEPADHRAFTFGNDDADDEPDTLI